MTTLPQSLTSWLLDQIAEDKAVARATGVTGFDVKWGGAIVAGYGSSMDGEHVGDVVDQNLADHRTVSMAEADAKYASVSWPGDDWYATPVARPVCPPESPTAPK